MSLGYKKRKKMLSRVERMNLTNDTVGRNCPHLQKQQLRRIQRYRRNRKNRAKSGFPTAVKHLDNPSASAEKSLFMGFVKKIARRFMPTRGR